MRDTEYRYTPKKKRSGGKIALLFCALALAVLIPAAMIYVKFYMMEPDTERRTASSQSGPSEPADSDTPPPEDGPDPADDIGGAPEPEEKEASGPVAESERVEQAYFDDAVFFGDSLTSGISVYAMMSNAKVIASTGINPDSALTKACISVPGTDGYITMIDALRAAKPKKIYIMLGANWVGENTGISEETFLKHYRTLLETIVEQHPESIIYVQSMLPVSRAFETNENGKNIVGLTNAIIKDYNSALCDLAQEMGLYYLDVNSAIADSEGYLPDDSTTDGMHISPAYYDKWFEYLKTHAIPIPDESEEEGEAETEAAQADSASLLPADA